MAALYIVATPIGNLQDFSPRGAETLRQADLIIAEDTRVTMKLCQVFDLHAPLVSCHRHSEGNKAEGLAERIAEENLSAALVTDAGTPCISDPGNEVAAACIARGIPVIPIPGCCAAAAALSVSGFDTREFAFYGFLPREKKALREKLASMAGGIRIAVVHESPHRITDLTETIAETIPDSRLAVCCDLTKKHEKTIYGTPQTVLQALRENEKTEKGEYCVVIEMPETHEEATEETPCGESTEGKLIALMKEGCSLREAQDRLIESGEKKNAVKQAALTLKRLFSE